MLALTVSRNLVCYCNIVNDESGWLAGVNEIASAECANQVVLYSWLIFLGTVFLCSWYKEDTYRQIPEICSWKSRVSSASLIEYSPESEAKWKGWFSIFEVSKDSYNSVKWSVICIKSCSGCASAGAGSPQALTAL